MSRNPITSKFSGSLTLRQWPRFCREIGCLSAQTPSSRHNVAKNVVRGILPRDKRSARDTMSGKMSRTSWLQLIAC
jgi:hypothetical protein